ncbi:hypothetical protein [Bdellovibrio sp. KM01]|uniref:hypothetical protein n=1 Tax=Bdellovibrio sp. KM01 TaxID=2748865 RepID=UPI0015E97D16|nr:hypothetical protein [Bdellovibrio sp. KM01]QLY25648.1 hypothetical protein HW988_00940 [Bdellovibrio sp. KM01]
MFRNSLIVLALVFISISSLAEEVDMASSVVPAPPSDEINMSEPPFWMSSYDEFHDLQSVQKEFYLEKLLPYLSGIPGLNPVSKKQLLEASEWYQGWNHIRKKVYVSCQDKERIKTCEEIANIRLQALDILSNQKEENRKANEYAKEEKSKESAKKKKSK